MKQKQLNLGGTVYHIEMTEILLKDTDGPIDDHGLLMLGSQQYTRQTVVNWSDFALPNELMMDHG